MEKISEFEGEYRFLSNFYPATVKIAGLTFPSSEHAYQAFKSDRRELVTKFCDPNMTAGQAKKLGRQLNLRKDWENIKVGLMYSLVRDKFIRHEELKIKLLDTIEAELIEGNTWGDKIWGVCNGEGENLLGRILMLVRSELRSIEDAKVKKEIEDRCKTKEEKEEHKPEKTYSAKEFIVPLMEGE